MMRKFRAWDKEESVMIDWFTISQQAWNRRTSSIMYDILARYSPRYEVMYHIGLCKGSRDIYDGDILFDEIEGDNGDERHYFVVRWLKEKCSFVFMDYGDTVTNWEKFEEDLWHDWPIQVDQVHLDAMHYAGNIHENYELLLQ